MESRELVNGSFAVIQERIRARKALMGEHRAPPKVLCAQGAESSLVNCVSTHSQGTMVLANKNNRRKNVVGPKTTVP